MKEKHKPPRQILRENKKTAGTHNSVLMLKKAFRLILIEVFVTTKFCT